MCDQPGYGEIRGWICTRECPNCGRSVATGDRFCSGCGHRLSPEPRELSVALNVLRAFRNLFASRPPLTTVTGVVYERLPPPPVAESGKLVLIAVALFAGFYALIFGLDPTRLMGNIMYFVATYGVALLFLYWVYRSDKYEREPFKFVMFVFAWGVFSGIIAAPMNRALGPYFKEFLGNEALAAPFVEEPAKALGLYLLVRHKVYGKEFNTPLDGIVYGFAAGMGFFAAENFMYFLMHGPMNLVIRSLLCWGHGVYVATTGLWLAIGKVTRGRIEAADLAPGLLVATLLHFVWNGWGGWIGPLAAIAIFLQSSFMLSYLRRMIKEALRDEVLWGYARGRAPVETY